MGAWDTPNKPTHAKKRRWLRILGAVCGALALLLVVAYFVVTSAWFLKGVILPKVSAALNATITVEDASLSPFSAITLSKLQVQTTGPEPLLRAGEVHARYSLWAILRGHILIKEATVESLVGQLIEYADGTSNLDPILRSFGQEAKPKSTRSESAEPLQLDLQQIELKNVTLRYVKMLPAGGKQIAEISGLSLNADTIANDQTGKVRISTDLKFDQGMISPTNSLLTAKLGGELDLVLDAHLRPASIKAGLQLNVTEAYGAFRDAAEMNSSLETDLTSSEIRTLALRFSKGTTPLGTMTASGTFNPTTIEGRFNLVVAGLDRQVLNIGGAMFGADFNATQINSSNVVELAQGANSTTVNGQVAVNRFSLTLKGQSTPTIDLAATYNVTIDRAAKQALLNIVTISAERDKAPLLRGALIKPMRLDWSGGANAVEESAFELVVTNLNLVDWGAFTSDFEPAGRLNLCLNVFSQQAGKKLKFDFNTQIAEFSARIGGNRIEPADGTIALHADLDDFTQINLSSLEARITRQKQPVLNLGASGKVDLRAMDLDLQTSLDVFLPPLTALLGRPDLKVSSGTLKFTGGVHQQNMAPGQAANAQYDRTVGGALRLEGLTRIFHKGIEQKSGRSVRKLENTELYDDTLYRPEHHRL